MRNYEYIIASLPALGLPDGRTTDLDADALIAGIRNLLDGPDVAVYDLLLEGFDPDKLCADFYARTAKSRNPFIKGYFLYDLQLRNLKVENLNSRLGRPEGTDMLEGPECDDDTPIREALALEDILKKERALDNLLWEKIEQLTCLHILDLDVILGFTARLKITDRWLKLDPEKGREMLRTLVEEIRKTR